MRNIDDMKLVIIGMGYLMEYIAPCYQALPGISLRERAMGVTADAQAVAAKEQATGIPVILNDNAGALRKMNPDVILFAPPPSLAASLTEQVLVPYYKERKAAGEELPLLFAFPPTPVGSYYQEQLGAECRVANILPNMIREIAGRPSEEAGFTMVTLPENHGWNREELAFLTDFFAPLGQVVFLTPQEVKGALAVSCSNQMLTEVLLDMEELALTSEDKLFVIGIAPWMYLNTEAECAAYSTWETLETDPLIPVYYEIRREKLPTVVYCYEYDESILETEFAHYFINMGYEPGAMRHGIVLLNR